MREQFGEFDPFLVLTAAADLSCQSFESLKRFNLDLQFRNRPGGSSLINYFLLPPCAVNDGDRVFVRTCPAYCGEESLFAWGRFWCRTHFLKMRRAYSGLVDRRFL